VGKLEGMRHSEESLRGDDIIKRDFLRRWEGVNYFDTAQDTDKWWTCGKVMIKF
jgi:hypothetical protein